MRFLNFSFRLVLLGCFLLGVFACQQTNSTPPATNFDAILQESWTFYKNRFMPNQERVESNNYGGTITEGQSYAMMKAVWMNDPTVFEKTWQWTRRHMKRPNDSLLGWRWGDKGNGKYGLIETENATDGDQDIAYALLLAGEKWKRPDYIKSAQVMMNDIWRLNVIDVNGHYYLLPGTWEGFRQEYLTVDPSYYAPYVYRKFSRYDAAHSQGWLALATESYATLEACSNLTVTKLPPNWCGIDWKTNRIHFSDKQGEGSRDFSYDAFRVFWRMAMDAKLGSPEAKAYLQKHTYLLTDLARHKTLPEGFTAGGQSRGNAPSGFALSSALAQNHILYPQTDAQFYRQNLQPHYRDGYWLNDYNDFLHSVIWLHLYTLRMDTSVQ